MSDVSENKSEDAEPFKYLSRSRSTSRARGEVFYTIEFAAERLAMTATALRARCRRAAVREGRDVVAYIGGGIVAYKIGRIWRVKFPPSP